jgi:hypothetical protein
MATRCGGETIGGTSERGAHRRAVSTGVRSSGRDSVSIVWRGCQGRGWKGRRGAPGRGEARGGDGWAEWWLEEASAREVLTAGEDSRHQLRRSTRRCGGLTHGRRRAQGQRVVNGISIGDSWHDGSQWWFTEDRGVAMKEQTQDEQRGREGGLHLDVAATWDKDRAVRRMGYAWRPRGQVARAVRQELPLSVRRGRE